MIPVNMHEAKTRLSALVKSVEEDEETAVLQRNAKPVAELVALKKAKSRNLDPDPSLKPVLSSGYDPTEPLSSDEWPEDSR